MRSGILRLPGSPLLISALSCAALFLTGVFAQETSGPQQTSSPPVCGVSLRVLQERLRSAEGQSPAEELLRLAGLTRVDGFITDPAAKDIVLVGAADPSGEPLHTEDFVIALRNAWVKGRDTPESVLDLGFLGCSIDHDAGTFQVLMQAAQRLGRHEPMAGDTDRWNKLCERPMQISVSQTPANSHFAQVLVEADLSLKKLMMGVDRPDPSFRSLVDFIKEQAELVEKTGGRAMMVPLLHVWLVPGANVYAEAGNTTWLDACPIVVSDEECMVMDGRFGCTGLRIPPVEKFAGYFSRHFGDVAKVRPEFARLQSLYRFVALARIFKYKGIRRSISYLLDSFPVPPIETPTFTTGLSQLLHIAKPRLLFGIKISKWLIPACGGIKLDIDVEQAEVITRSELEQLESNVLKARPSLDSLSWPVQR